MPRPGGWLPKRIPERSSMLCSRPMQTHSGLAGFVARVKRSQAQYGPHTSKISGLHRSAPLNTHGPQPRCVGASSEPRRTSTPASSMEGQKARNNVLCSNGQEAAAQQCDRRHHTASRKRRGICAPLPLGASILASWQNLCALAEEPHRAVHAKG